MAFFGPQFDPSVTIAENCKVVPLCAVKSCLNLIFGLQMLISVILVYCHRTCIIPLSQMFQVLSKCMRYRRSQSGRALVSIACFILIGTLILVSMSSTEERSQSFEPARRKPIAVETRRFGEPSVSIVNGTEIMWQMADDPKAVFFLAHGCYGHAGNFWTKSASCPSCVGLPEERRIVLEAIARRFSVLAISSAGTCWTFGDELVVVKNLIAWWVSKYNLEKLPLVALGASSGGYFVSRLAVSVKFSSITLMIAEGLFHKIKLTSSYPPTLFVHMPKDVIRKIKIAEYMELLKGKGIESAEVQSHEFPLTERFFSDRIQGIDQTLSAELFKLFIDQGFIDSKGYMVKDGRATRWKEALQLRKDLQFNKKLFHHVEEELNLAFAYHEMTSLQLEEIFAWFESHAN